MIIVSTQHIYVFAVEVCVCVCVCVYVCVCVRVCNYVYSIDVMMSSHKLFKVCNSFNWIDVTVYLSDKFNVKLARTKVIANYFISFTYLAGYIALIFAWEDQGKIECYIFLKAHICSMVAY